MCGVSFLLSALSTQLPLRNSAMSLPSSTSIPPRLVNRNGSGSIQLAPPLLIETLVTGVRALPPRMNPNYESSPSIPRIDQAPTSGVEDRARQGSQTTAIAAVVKALNSTHINPTSEDEAQSTDSDEMLVDDIPSTSTTPSPGPRICQWSPTCNADLSGVVEFSQASDHLGEAHGMKDKSRDGRKVMMKCPWPGCKSKPYQEGSAPRHLLDQHIDPEGKMRRRHRVRCSDLSLEES
ncbi:hypothetical protein PENSPDRAFT_658865 [Peniophora sp. CONT]|nr:hypothetical protein PENSPDRAFT_658865 [Peniophora sp. CONT]